MSSPPQTPRLTCGVPPQLVRAAAASTNVKVFARRSTRHLRVSHDVNGEGRDCKCGAARAGRAKGLLSGEVTLKVATFHIGPQTSAARRKRICPYPLECTSMSELRRD